MKLNFSFLLSLILFLQLTRFPKNWMSGTFNKWNHFFRSHGGSAYCAHTAFKTLHVRWLSRTFNRTASTYQTATRWDLPPYWTNIWLLNDALLISVCLLDDLIPCFCYSNLTRISGGFELASAMTLQANQLTKCTSYPKVQVQVNNYYIFYVNF